jgi:hypothetical protein
MHVGSQHLMRRLFVVVMLCTTLIGGRQVANAIDPDQAQLDRFQAAADTPLSIADEPVVPCKPGLCAKLYAMHGVANLQVAMQGRSVPSVCPTASPTVRDRLETARSDLALVVNDPTGLDRSAVQTLWRDRAQALYCLAEQVASTDGLPFAAQAESAAAHANSLAGNVLGGWASLYAATFGTSPASRCIGARTAAANAAAGLTHDPDTAIAEALNRIAEDARTAAAQLPECSLP